MQLPFLLGLAPFEKIAPLVAHWFVGKTGRHLFLTDGDSNHLPLLRRMVTDCDEGKFMLVFLTLYNYNLLVLNLNIF